jgi:hypothetical protein
MTVDIEKYKGYTPIEMHRAIWNRELSENQFDAWIEYIIGECIKICELGSATQMTSMGAANEIRQWFAYG